MKMLGKFTLVALLVGFAVCQVSEEGSVSSNFVVDGKVVAKFQSRVTFHVNYTLNSGVSDTASFVINTELMSANATQEGNVLETSIEWQATSDSNPATFQMRFIKDEKTNDVTWTTAKLTVPVNNEYKFNTAAEHYDSELVVIYDVNRVVSSGKNSYFCSSQVVIPSSSKSDTFGQLQLTRTQLVAFNDKFATDPKYRIACAEDAGTTTQSPPTTTMEPASPGTWNVTDGDTTCIKMKAALTLQLNWNQYVDENKTDVRNVTDKYAVPAHYITVDDASSCAVGGDNKTQQLVLDFWTTWKLTLEFTESAGNFNLSHVKLHYNLKAKESVDKFPNAAEPFEGDHEGAVQGMSAKTTESYKCENGVTKLAVDDKFTLMLAQLQVQAETDAHGWNEAQLCNEDIVSSDIVPIIVGSCLAALVVIVLVAYLIGRARSQRAGYSSV